MASEKITAIIEELKGLTVLELQLPLLLQLQAPRRAAERLLPLRQSLT